MKNISHSYFVMLFSILEILWMVGCGAICDDGSIVSALGGTDATKTWVENCKYYCSEDQSRNEFSDLSWDQITQLSHHLQYPSTEGLCDDASDLVYSSDTTDCGNVPRCGCSDTSQIEYHIEYELFKQVCRSSVCTEHTDYDSSVYNGASRGSNANPYHWDDFQCPPVNYCNDTTIDTNGVEKNVRHYPGSGWFKTSGSDCTTYCYCDYDAETHCEEGYEAIESSRNIDLVDSFRQRCGSSLGTCLEDASQWTEGSCRYCPRCGCGDNAGNYDTYWTVEVEETFEYLFAYTSMHEAQQRPDARCYNCSCSSMTATDVNGDQKDYDGASCRTLSSYLDGYGECPPDTTLSATKCYSSDDLVFNADNAYEQECGSGYTGDYCGWDYSIDNNNPTNHDIDRGCQNNLMCDAMGVDDGKCVYYHTVMDYDELLSDCDNVQSYNGHVVNDTTYMSCCTDDLCNTGEIDITQCTYSDVGEKFMTGFMSCNLKAQAQVFHCPDDNDQKETDCAQLIAFGEEFYGCFCDAYGIIYDKLSDKKNKQYAEDSSEAFWKGLNHWLKAFGCKTREFGCNYKTGGVTKDGAKAMSTFVTNVIVFSALWALYF
eukprot:512302_1